MVLGLRSSFSIHPEQLPYPLPLLSKPKKDVLCGKEHDKDRNEQKIVATQNLTTAITGHVYQTAGEKKAFNIAKQNYSKTRIYLDYDLTEISSPE